MIVILLIQEMHFKTQLLTAGCMKMALVTLTTSFCSKQQLIQRLLLVKVLKITECLALNATPVQPCQGSGNIVEE